MDVCNWIGNKALKPQSKLWGIKVNPANEEIISRFAHSNNEDVKHAVSEASKAFKEWSGLTPIARGSLLFRFARELEKQKSKLAWCVSTETGKSINQSLGEVQAAIAQCEFFASEGRRLYTNSLTSENPNKTAQTIRVPHGVVGLIVPANTPIANIAWKIFPALICGNTVVLKASEDAPQLALMIGKIGKKSGLPAGVLNIIQGQGKIAGEALVLNHDVKCISFTGSTIVGMRIGEQVSRRLGRCSLELGGINSIIILNDADLENAIHWTLSSAFSNAGQRCASASRILVQDKIYKSFKIKLKRIAENLKLGVLNDDFFGPVINKKQYDISNQHIINLKKIGGKALFTFKNKIPKKGFYVPPTIFESINPNSKLLKEEVFGPIATLHNFKNINQALRIANNTNFGLTAAVHTNDINKSLYFIHNLRAGVVNINSGTFGSEPHMPFGGFGYSGNGAREPGTQAIDIYTELKNYSFTKI